MTTEATDRSEGGLSNSKADRDSELLETRRSAATGLSSGGRISITSGRGVE